ncbi:MAG: serine hydrolase [Hydrogenophilales bacterium]|nr:serine hydrolase [Hydrogenophilales bacterium]
MPITISMKQIITPFFALFFAMSIAQAECLQVLNADRLDFGVKTGLQEYDCKPVDPIADKVKQFDPSILHAKGDPDLRSAMALILDEKTGEIIYAKNAEARTPIASITKLMTAMVTLDARLALDEKITLTNDDIDRVKGTHSRLKIGAQLTRRELLQLALMSSENRAAAALARTYPGGNEAFIAAMNRKASRLGMASTRFADSTGLRSENQSTAEDLARMVRAAHTYPIITELTTATSYDLQMPIYKRARALAQKKLANRKHATRTLAFHNVAFRNTNKLVSDKDWQIGVSKTGYISEAGHCLVMQATIANQQLIIVLLDSDGKYTRIGDAVRIKRWLESSLKPAKRVS